MHDSTLATHTDEVAVSGCVYLWVFAIVFPAFPQLFQLSISSKKSVPSSRCMLLLLLLLYWLLRVRVNVYVVIPGS